MSRLPKYDILFEPLTVGPKVFKNRFYQTPHCSRLGSEQPGAQAAFRGMKAEGGWAVVNTEYCSIHPEDDDSPLVPARLWSDADVANLSLMCEKVHEHGALAGIELHYGGNSSSGYTTRVPGRAASQMPGAITCQSTASMDKRDIREVQGYYVAAARRARSAGFDIVNVHGTEGIALPSQFLMRCENRRTDEYGGSFANRARFWLETLEVVREAVGDDCALTGRHCIESLHEDGRGIGIDEEGIGFIELADHLVDFWDVQVSAKRFGVSNRDSGASRFFAENFQGPWVAKIRPHTSKPIVGVGRFTNPDTMVEVIRSGQQDVIGAARPSIADPFLPSKIEEGRLDEIRECIGCNMCLSRVEQASNIICTQNATTGEEYRRGWHPERFSQARNANQDILVVGAGPAGLECAVVLAKRGFARVHLVDAQDDVGGALRWIRRLPGLAEWGRVVDYRKVQVGKLRNLDFIPNTSLDAAAIREYGADIVVMATGSHWATDGLNGCSQDTILGADAGLPHVLTPEQIMVDGKEIPPGRVVVYDCDGYFLGVSIAEFIAGKGREVLVVTPFEKLAPYMAYTGESSFMTDRLEELRVKTATGCLVTEVRDGRVGGRSVSRSRPVGWEAAGVVLVTQRLSNEQVYRTLKAEPERLESEGVRGLYRAGDCRAPRIIADAIFDGHRLAREIESANPDEALPFIRENRVLGATDAEYDAVLSPEALGR
jgi:dimethylamine/trimethylamine dehydrogenase